MKSFPYRCALAAAVCLLLALPAWGAEDAPASPPPAPVDAVAGIGNVQALIDAGRFEEAIVALRPLLGQEPVDPNVLFLYGLASLEASRRPGRTDDEQEILLNEAIAAFHTMLVANPGLVRVRLELARAFYLKGEDGLARSHFEAVLAGGVPEEVAANVNLFLEEIRSRGRWSFNLGFALAPDSNIGAGSEERTIYVPVFGQPLPFERDAEELTSSGVGVSVWGGAEYQVPVGERFRLRAGADAARREYSGSEFDQFYLSTHLGPRWLVDQDTEGSLLASARQRWTGTVPDSRELGARLEVGRRLTPRVTVFANASWHDNTLEYLAGRIRGRTGEQESVAVIHGGVPRDQRRATIAAFNDDPKVRFLLANDTAGEGVNLQRGAHLMVNYDLPWNPNRLEQRFGRIHRIGQTEVCQLWNLVASGTREGAVYERLLEKLETARETLGGKVYDVLGELFEARPLRELFMEAIRYGEKPEVREQLFRAIDGVVDVDNINTIVGRNKLTREGLDPATVRGVREEMERAAARRLQPHHIRSFFEAAFAEAGGIMRGREKGRAEVTRVPPNLRDRDRLIGRADPVLERYRRIRFDKAGIAGQPQATLVAPGHPLLDSLVDLTLERYRELLTRGAMLVDESNRYDAPRVLIALRNAIRDGRSTRHGKPQTISERLQFVWLDEASGAVGGGPAPHLDCRPASDEEQAAITAVLDEAWLTAPLEERARTLAITDLVPRHLREVKERRLPELDKIEAAVKERMRREITHLQHRALELEAEEKAGKKPRLNSENVRRQAEALSDRLQLRLADIARQRDIAPLPPEICSAALVVPADWLLRPEEKDSKTVTAREDTADAESRKVVEAKAMEAVMALERSLGYEPQDVSTENRGYDIESRDPKTGSLRFIEAKGRRADADSITITRNEMLAALNSADAYILAVVLVDGGFAHKPLYVPNPAPVFGPEPGFNEVHRAISTKAITAAAQAVS